VAVQETESVTVTGETSYAVDPNVEVSFVPTMVVFQNRGDSTVFASFDGTTDALELLGGESLSIPMTGKSYAWLYRKVWVRESASPGGTEAVCRVTLFG
jgi:hypothetical protein